MFCTKCGSKIEVTDKSCLQCGAPNAFYQEPNEEVTEDTKVESNERRDIPDDTEATMVLSQQMLEEIQTKAQTTATPKESADVVAEHTTQQHTESQNTVPQNTAPQEKKKKPCIYCGAEISENAKFCTRCGKQQIQKVELKKVPKFCTKCGSPLTPGTKFCTKCGNKIAEVAVQPGTPVVSQPMEQPGTPVAPQPMEQPGTPVAPQPVEQPGISAQPQRASVTETGGYTQPLQEDEANVQGVTGELKQEDNMPDFDPAGTPVYVSGSETVNALSGKEQVSEKEKSGSIGMTIAIVIMVIAIVAFLASGAFLLVRYLRTKSADEEQQQTTEIIEEDSSDATEEAAADGSSQAPDATEEVTAPQLAEGDFDLTQNNVITISGPVVTGPTGERSVQLAAPVKFYGDNEAAQNQLVENVTTVAMDASKLPAGMLESIVDNTPVNVTGTASINAGRVIISIDGMTDAAGADMVAAFQSANDYILPTSSDVYLTEDDIKDLTLQEINYAKNEIYARHGRKFKSKELKQYFNSKSWYNGTIKGSDFDENSLSEVERANVKLLKDREFDMDPNGYQLDKN